MIELIDGPCKGTKAELGGTILAVRAPEGLHLYRWVEIDDEVVGEFIETVKEKR